MVEPAELQALSQSKPTSPWVTCGILAAGTVTIVVLLIVWAVLGERREEQNAREAAVASIQRTTRATLTDNEGKFTATLAGEDARILGELAKQVLEEGAGVDSWSFHHQILRLDLYDDNGAITQIGFEHRQQYYLSQSDEWYSGRTEFTCLLQQIYVAQALEAGNDPESLRPGVLTVIDSHRTSKKYGDHPWNSTEKREQDLAAKWLDAFNRVSGQPRLELH